MLPFSRLLDALKQIPDPRRDQGKRYPLPNLLLFSILAILSGARGFSDIIIFMEQRLNALNEVFGINLKRAPSINTVRVLLHTLDCDCLETALRTHAKSLLTGEHAGMLPIIALDGKTLRAGQSGEAYKVLSQDRRLAVDYVCPSICTFVEDYIEE